MPLCFVFILFSLFEQLFTNQLSSVSFVNSCKRLVNYSLKCSSVIEIGNKFYFTWFLKTINLFVCKDFRFVCKDFSLSFPFISLYCSYTRLKSFRDLVSYVDFNKALSHYGVFLGKFALEKSPCSRTGIPVTLLC